MHKIIVNLENSVKNSLQKLPSRAPHASRLRRLWSQSAVGHAAVQLPWLPDRERLTSTACRCGICLVFPQDMFQWMYFWQGCHRSDTASRGLPPGCTAGDVSHQWRSPRGCPGGPDAAFTVPRGRCSEGRRAVRIRLPTPASAPLLSPPRPVPSGALPTAPSRHARWLPALHFPLLPLP